MKKTEEILAIEKGRVTENFSVSTSALKENKKLFHAEESDKKTGKTVLKPRIEAIHAGKTRNKTFYPADKLRGDPLLHSGVYSWTNPYPKPMIKNHDHDSEPTGRIENAMYITNSATGRESVVIVPTITDPDAIEKILDGRYMTVSIGATTDAAICSICGTNLVEEGWCGHEKGQVYDGQECYWIIGNIWFDECSWVNVPADQDAQVIDKGEATIAEAFAESNGEYYDLSKKQGDKDYVLTEKVAETYGLVTNKENTLPEESNDGSGKAKEGTDEMADPNKVETVNPEENLEDQGTEPKVDSVPEPSDNEQATEGSEPEDSEVQEGAVESEADDEAGNQKEESEVEDNDAKDTPDEVVEKQQVISNLQQRIEELEAENQALLDSNANLSAQLHKHLVERVVDLRIALKKPGMENREAAIEGFIGRTYESLQDSLNDLLEESKVPVGRSAAEGNQVVKNPAGGAVNGEKNQNIVTEGDEEAIAANIKLSKEEVLKRLFGGKYRI